MFKKMIALLVIFAMLVPLSSAVAADEPTSQPTIEEILNGYHEKAFAAQTAEENGGASTYARSGSGSSQTLEQETVDELTAAGYEAYHVTGDNYEALEETLHTDFAEMGLDPNSSYVVVISGEDPATQSNSSSNSNSRMKDFPTMEDFYGDYSSTFTYTQDGTTYTMRYVTVTTANDTNLFKYSIYNLSNAFDPTRVSNEALSHILYAVVDDLLQVPVSSLISLITGSLDDENHILISPESLTLHASTAWTRQYIQVQHTATGEWYSSQWSSYAVSRARCVGYLYNVVLNAPQWYEGQESSCVVYAQLYDDYAQRKRDAVVAYTVRKTTFRGTGDISFYFAGADDVEIGQNGSPLFVHHEYTNDIPITEDMV